MNKKKPFFKGLSAEMVGMTGFEPATSCSRSKRTTKLCYIPMSYTILFRFMKICNKKKGL